MDFDLSDAQNELRSRSRALAENRIAARAAEIDDSLFDLRLAWEEERDREELGY